MYANFLYRVEPTHKALSPCETKTFTINSKGIGSILRNLQKHFFDKILILLQKHFIKQPFKD